MRDPYFILGYPRSRLAWLAVAMTHGASHCLFEATVGTPDASPRTTEQLETKLASTAADYPGNSDCANALILDRILERWPTARLVVVTRDTDAVAASLRRLGISPSPKFFEATSKGLDKALLHKHSIAVSFDVLDDSEVGEAIWEYCVRDEPFDRRRWQMLAELNIQVRPEIERNRVCMMPEVLALHGGA